MKKIVIALGGNAIRSPRGDGKFESQFKELMIFADSLKKIVKKNHQIVITHGNGPQVGDILLQQDLSKDYVKPLPLAVCDAQTQGQIGFMLQQALLNSFQKSGIKKEVVTIITQILVDRNDSAFSNPTKPIGPFYTPGEAKEFRKKGIKMKEITYRSFRRVVASPRPKEILEIEAIKNLISQDMLVIACGGGGIPIVEIKNQISKIKNYKPIDAVIDKDLASSLLAREIGADILLILTDVKNVFLNFGKRNQIAFKTLTMEQAKRYLKEGQFPPGSMGPKVEAAVEFAERGGRTIIAHLRDFSLALSGKAGTTIEN
ncbi:MAG: carbamate kinase [Parcubacteria group bacterium CG11_big_fil_rev_8_21_14_0_20_39_14]|nr:MAG: carbamate kinase [Parcubacteria group bacterium CG11_big_fil_rev_8_21_14_0_20_39_14]PIS35573.1 MAG: carbamate kinase [Parcubacteria group bacterium CG08_land_8_20_14_0_20_38_56]